MLNLSLQSFKSYATQNVLALSTYGYFVVSEDTGNHAPLAIMRAVLNPLTGTTTFEGCAVFTSSGWHFGDGIAVDDPNYLLDGLGSDLWPTEWPQPAAMPVTIPQPVKDLFLQSFCATC